MYLLHFSTMYFSFSEVEICRSELDWRACSWCDCSQRCRRRRRFSSRLRILAATGADPDYKLQHTHTHTHGSIIVVIILLLGDNPTNALSDQRDGNSSTSLNNRVVEAVEEEEEGDGQPAVSAAVRD